MITIEHLVPAGELDLDEFGPTAREVGNEGDAVVVAEDYVRLEYEDGELRGWPAGDAPYGPIDMIPGPLEYVHPWRIR